MKFKKYVGSWNYEQNKEISGKILNIREEAGKFKTRIYVLETEENVFDVFGSQVLDDKMTNMCIKVGDFVKIVFNGMKQGKESEYKDFDVYLGSENSETD